MNLFDLDRFITAQDRYDEYNTALNEVRNGRKESHWIWFIFPQIATLGQSDNSKFYGISSLLEAKAYLENETLSARLYEITDALLEQKDTAEQIFGGTDAMKVRSCMTLFDIVSPGDKFNDVLENFYERKRCHRTLAIVKGERIVSETKTREDKS